MLHQEFIPGEAGNLLLTYYLPENRRKTERVVLFFPPFAEEMNKSRRTAALLGRALADRGLGLLIPDLFGTGDSEGDFSEGHWDLWLSDMANAHKWLIGRGVSRVDILGLRLGALLAWDYLRQAQGRVGRVALWSPVLLGKQQMTQFLRLKMASGLFGGEKRETVTELRKKLETESVEVAGYSISPKLIKKVDELVLGLLDNHVIGDLLWLEMVAQMKTGPSPAARKWSEMLRSGGTIVNLEVIEGPAFWSTQEITEVPELIFRTVEYFSG